MKECRHTHGGCIESWWAMQGHELNGQLGFFAEWMEGINPERMRLTEKRDWISRIPIEWVTLLGVWHLLQW